MDNAPDDMVFVPGGTFQMGSNDFYPEEAPVHRVSVDGLWFDRTPITNAAFAAFVVATGHRTLAERVPDAADYPDAPPELLRAASLVFTPPGRPVNLRNSAAWWSLIPGADWRHPYGPRSSIEELGDHPVVHVSYDDALAYCAWAGKDLPTEAEWEFAARGGRDGLAYAWGDALLLDGRHMANTWQGAFPHENAVEDGFARTSPVGSFPANPYGLFDMIGNVWEWTTDFYAPRHAADADKPCCVPKNPRNLDAEASRDPRHPGFARKVVKGGSHLCAPNYCRRYRPAARQPQAIDTTTTHIGFRCVRRGA